MPQDRLCLNPDFDRNIHVDIGLKAEVGFCGEIGDATCVSESEIPVD